MNRPSYHCAIFLAVALISQTAISESVRPQMVQLSDSELDAITVGSDICAFFGINGPCVASALQLFNPQGPPQLQAIAVPLPSHGTVSLSLHAASSSPDGSRVQIATQMNSVSPQPLLGGNPDFSPPALLLRTTPIIRP